MKDDESIESRVRQAMRSRAQHFKDLADSLTFEGARRLLEKDLNLDTHALDKHKKYVKQLLEKILSGTEDDENVSKNTKQIKSEKVKKEEEDKPKEQKVTDDTEGIIEDSPVMGLLSGTKSSKSENPKTEDKSEDKMPTEDMIKEAVWKKATYFRSKSEELTVAGVRRLIEEDLELKKFSLDPFKKLISKQLDEVLNSQSDTPNKTGSKSDSESEDMEVEVKPKKKPAVKTKVQKSEAPKKRKKPVQETEQPKKKKIKSSEETSVKKKVVKEADEDSSSDKSEPSEKSEKKEVAAPVYGKKVERLKSIIKACGMTVAPSVYRKAKQASEDKREDFLVKELKEILSKEGLSANPSEKEIKEVKRRKERAKELEGIDTSNIVSGSRRRSTFNFVAPPRPKAPIESDGDESEDSDNDDGDDSEDTGNEDVDDGDDQEVDDKVGDDKDDKDGDDEKEDVDADDGDDKDEDDKVDDSKSEEVTGNDEVV